MVRQRALLCKKTYSSLFELAFLGGAGRSETTWIFSLTRSIPGQLYNTATKIPLCIPSLGIARPQSQFPHSCVCEHLYNPRIGQHIYCSRIGRSIVRIYKSLTDTWIWNGDCGVAVQFLFWEYLFQIFGVVFLVHGSPSCGSDSWFLSSYVPDKVGPCRWGTEALDYSLTRWSKIPSWQDGPWAPPWQRELFIPIFQVGSRLLPDKLSLKILPFKMGPRLLYDKMGSIPWHCLNLDSTLIRSALDSSLTSWP